MNLLRRSLSLSEPKVKTVTTFANDYSFAELGRFAAAYRALYGEQWSANLRRTIGRSRREMRPQIAAKDR